MGFAVFVIPSGLYCAVMGEVNLSIGRPLSSFFWSEEEHTRAFVRHIDGMIDLYVVD